MIQENTRLRSVKRTRRACVHLYIYVYTNDLVKSTTDVACHVTIHFDTPPLGDAIKDTRRSGVKLKVYRYFQGALKLRDVFVGRRQQDGRKQRSKCD